MEAYLLDWLSLLLRWAHLVVGIAWIGASFYFIWLDNHLEPSADAKLSGELWAVHGGGFYHAEKFKGTPPVLPARPHWFKWEAYWTWITGFFLLVLVYYAGAELYLIDPSVMPLSKSAAIAIGLGTLMVGNVAHVIIPGQRRMVQALSEGRAPDPKDGAAGKQRSVHNTYFTLPVLFTMIASHYAFTFGARWNWLVLVALTLAGALIRVWFVMRHKGSAPAWPLVAGIGLLFALMLLFLPKTEDKAAAVKFEEVTVKWI